MLLNVMLDTILDARDTLLIKGETCSYETYIKSGRQSTKNMYKI